MFKTGKPEKPGNEPVDIAAKAAKALEMVAARGDSEDGKVRVNVREGGIYVTVYPARGSGRDVDSAMVYNALREKEIVDINVAALTEAVIGKEAKPVRIADRKPLLDRDGQVKVVISEDGMEASVEILPPLGGKPFPAEQVKEALAKAGVVEGIMEDQIEAAVKQQNKHMKIVVARGSAAVDGSDAFIEYKFARNSEKVTPVELEDGRVDWHNLQLVENVQPGQVLAVRVPPTRGKLGKTVTGKILVPKPGKDVRLPKGKNAEVSQDGLTLIALIAGQVVSANGRINVYAIHEVKGDVDFSTGNIDFVGNVVVRGNVLSGFTVRAAGSVEVRGSVDGASIIAGGDVVILRGIQGKDRGQLIAGNNVYARFLEHAKVEAVGEVVVTEAIMHCDVNAGKKIEVNGKKGLIVGGLLRAGELVSAKVIGAKLGTRTEIEVGVIPEIRKELTRLTQEMGEKERNLIQVEKAFKMLSGAVEQGRQLAEKEKDLLLKLSETYEQLQEETNMLRERLSQTEKMLENATRGQVRATLTVHPGTKITIGNATVLIRDELAKVLFYLQDGEIRQGTVY
ncbi:MAG: FapA family protein [Firmicutes bacterium]|nr:FapA family protein [Bacillota bacterium]